MIDTITVTGTVVQPWWTTKDIFVSSDRQSPCPFYVLDKDLLPRAMIGDKVVIVCVDWGAVASYRHLSKHEIISIAHVGDDPVDFLKEGF